jgi:hypothetical protein
MDKLEEFKSELTKRGVPFVGWVHPRSGDPWVSVRVGDRWQWVTEEQANPGARGSSDPGGKTGELMVWESKYRDDTVLPTGDPDIDPIIIDPDVLVVADDVARSHFTASRVPAN